MKVSIIGATGYTGAELLRLLAGHEKVDIVALTSESSAGASISSIYPHLAKQYNNVLVNMDSIDEIAAASDVVFIALPHGHAMSVGKRIAGQGVKIIDLGADYRFKDVSVYEQWYKVSHTDADTKSVYGLTELHRDKIKKAQIIGNPGCYTTASILAMAPLVKNNLIELSSVIIDAKSGVTGAGRTLNLNSHFCEAFENIKAYGVATHRHTPEIEMILSELATQPVTINFTPHLIPMDRGILCTCYANMHEGVTTEQINEAYIEMFGDEYFIRLLGLNGYPSTKHTRGSNYCDIGWHIDKRTQRVVVISAIDNLVKGAAGQAVQNMNVLFDLDEQLGLEAIPLCP